MKLIWGLNTEIKEIKEFAENQEIHDIQEIQDFQETLKIHKTPGSSSKSKEF